MWSNFSIALITLLLTLLVVFVWTIAFFAGGDSIPLAQVETQLAIRNMFFCLAAFILLFITSQLPIRRAIVAKLMLGFGLLFLGAWQALLTTLVNNSWVVAYWLHILAIPLGIAIASVGIFELGKAYQLNRLLLGSYRKIEHSLATVDQLTQLYNRRYFFATCPELMRKLQQDHSQPTIICLQLTNLHDINNSLGYQGGDALLTQAAKQLLRHIRSGDIAARLSGRRFAIFLPDTRTGDAEEIVQRFLSHMEHVMLHNAQGEETVVSVKLGYSVCRANIDEGFEDLLRRAKQQST